MVVNFPFFKKVNKADRAEYLDSKVNDFYSIPFQIQYPEILDQSFGRQRM